MKSAVLGCVEAAAVTAKHGIKPVHTSSVVFLLPPSHWVVESLNLSMWCENVTKLFRPDYKHYIQNLNTCWDSNIAKLVTKYPSDLRLVFFGSATGKLYGLESAGNIYEPYHVLLSTQSTLFSYIYWRLCTRPQIALLETDIKINRCSTQIL